MVAMCEQAKLPYAPIRRPDELFDDPQLNVPGGMVEVSLPDGRVTRIPALPLQFGDQRLGRRRDIPRAGEHSVAIAQELGMDRAAIEALIESGVLSVDA
jgi:crotonobetainyl-CoA:carnitine CoA-transferase CaiB-like acyl-CoA transferase